MLLCKIFISYEIQQYWLEKIQKTSSIQIPTTRFPFKTTVFLSFSYSKIVQPGIKKIIAKHNISASAQNPWQFSLQTIESLIYLITLKLDSSSTIIGNSAPLLPELLKLAKVTLFPSLISSMAFSRNTPTAMMTNSVTRTESTQICILSTKTEEEFG
jgi:hypothetical protein